MSALRESDKVRSSADLQEVIGTPIADLSGAIEDLRGACTRLQTSIRGVNSDLEETNKRLSAALDIQAETSTYLESIFASIPSGVIVVDAQGHIVLFNTAAEAITGFRSDEVKGRSYSKTVGKMVSQKQTPLYTLATGSSIDLQEKTLRTKAGESIAVSFSTSLLLDRNNGMKGAVEVITDLRRTKMLEEEVARARTLATIGEIAAVVAHEIRNPLGGIKGFASLLERDLRENPQGLSILRRISEGIEALETITGDLLEAGRHTKLKFTHTELGAEILNLVEMYEMAAKGEGKAISFTSTAGTAVTGGGSMIRRMAGVRLRVGRDR
jgi:PAS domain S-box-containing protein